MDERYAIKLCLTHRDPIGFEFLYKKYRKIAYFHAISILGNPEDAVDACQESFARAYSAILSLRRLDAFYPWFYRVLRNCCLNMISRKKTSARYIQDTPEEEGVNPSHPGILLEQREEQLTVWHALEALTPEFREILIMKYVEGCSYEQISERLDIPRGTVMSRLYHARKAFRDRYTKVTDSEDR